MDSLARAAAPDQEATGELQVDSHENEECKCLKSAAVTESTITLWEPEL